jgi:alpha-L-fucosidase
MKQVMHRTALAAVICLAAGLPVQAQQMITAQPELISQELVMRRPPFKASHASTLTELADGSVAVAWFGGPVESDPQVCIWFSKHDNNGWTEPVQVADGIQNADTRYACWNPVLFTSRDHTVYLFYKVGPSPRDWWGMMKYSKDNGRSWSAAQRLPGGMLGPIKNKPVQLDNGDILYPSSTESRDEKDWHIHIEKTDSQVQHWEKYPIQCDSFGVIQPSLLTYDNGKRLQLLCRSRQNAIVETWSEDNGRSWLPLRALGLANPNSGIDAVTLHNGLQLLVYNPALKGAEWYNGRNELWVALSKDGQHWIPVYQLEKHAQGEYSYPAVIQTRDGLVHISYTYGRRNIKHVVLKVKNGARLAAGSSQ